MIISFEGKSFDEVRRQMLSALEQLDDKAPAVAPEIHEEVTEAPVAVEAARDALKALQTAKGNTIARDTMIAATGCKAFSSVKPEMYAALVKACQEALNAK